MSKNIYQVLENKEEQLEDNEEPKVQLNKKEKRAQEKILRENEGDRVEKDNH